MEANPGVLFILQCLRTIWPIQLNSSLRERQAEDKTGHFPQFILITMFHFWKALRRDFVQDGQRAMIFHCFADHRWIPVGPALGKAAAWVWKRGQRAPGQPTELLPFAWGQAQTGACLQRKRGCEVFPLRLGSLLSKEEKAKAAGL